MALASRQRRLLRANISTTTTLPSSSYSKLDKPKRSGGGKDAIDGGLRWLLPLRYMSAWTNIIHDCDEVFNYWEPLHYLLFKSGFQTWEYRFPAKFVLYVCYVSFFSIFFSLRSLLWQLLLQQLELLWVDHSRSWHFFQSLYTP